jgi:hypothetical protein
MTIRRFRRWTTLPGVMWVVVAAIWLMPGGRAAARDYIVTIAGGYEPEGNQASLEANVLFFQQVLREEHSADHVHDLYFADGSDDDEDVQTAVKVDYSGRPATELIAALHRRGGERLEYRDHRVPRVTAALLPDPIRDSFRRIAAAAQPGDRVIVYVTAHGGEGSGRDPYNTSILGWNDTSIRMREFSGWLDELPEEVPVVLVMAQCYTGGFAHAIFAGGDPSRGLARHQRVGFFAQQHDLAAAGCRPDIENDEEYSSYFWGALVGRSRTGTEMPGCDADGNGVVSFAEAHAQAIVAGETIDIPLTASESLLRRYSRVPEFTNPFSRPRRGRPQPSGDAPRESAAGETPKSTPATPAASPTVDDSKLQRLTGPVGDLVSARTVAEQRIVRELCRQLGFSETDDVATILAAAREHQESRPSPSRGPRQRSSSGRRELLAEVGEKWPELADRERWSQSELLREGDQDALLAEIRKLPGFEVYERRRGERVRETEQAQAHELRGVKLRRLVQTLESAVLANNLPLVATPEIVARYRQMQELEATSLRRE